ncbi:hypothetical protein A2866_04475 [Candidatus Roizmanbacteria bacterium RIFCSPHIGHO2_01_FULL_39_8]|uniref:Uncharacterized protein n=3 Tax=Candidatus Roizmaniibacteriota TaxID=1752723 RepID=A0A1F7GRU1_9BACT|nr:MAG: hypothetical protein A2866_04475 [Candidatus Roizmanbacteria bacterium RIFCSPHIGHO2_01_FULL_39_8]OGK26013.1 MAG: hypothetical protein A3C28_02050 [Candidatus Roizmanbacteria bacterium RIFCSPHIGHO2_02_FULL_39_9]OGK34826.1 MAG: hypothetical protein A3F60_03920 [Candidatus Roizmanbacteria bacterium RIFCSPHIGHO2_12_FULL_39_8]
MQRPIRNGFMGAVGLIIFYFIIMGLSSGSWSDTISQFKELWYWMILLSAGFGTQIGLYSNLKTQISLLRPDKNIGTSVGQAKSVAATSTGTSATAMVACCAHHLSEVLPLIGLSAASVFLTRYQIPLIIFGVFMNLLGIVYMIKQIRKVKTHIINSK